MAKGLEKGKESLEWTLLRFFETFNISFLSYLIAINIFLIFSFPLLLLYEQLKKFSEILRLIIDENCTSLRNSIYPLIHDILYS